MEFAEINSPEAALVAGLLTSLHCAGMCGPLACVLMPLNGDRADAQSISSTYHLARLASYTLLGAIVGAAGRIPLAWLPPGVLRWAPWSLVGLFVVLAFRLDRYIPKARALSSFVWRVAGRLRRRSALGSAAVLGLATPALPCGPLYFVLALSALSGSAARGASFMLAFGLGTVPLLWLAQAQFHRVQRWLKPVWLGRLRVTLALGAAAVVCWRLRGPLGLVPHGVSTYLCF